MTEKKESITTFKASSLEVIETALLGSGLYLLAIWFGNGFSLDMEFVLKALYNALIVGACWMISDDWSCKWNNARDLCIWQEYVGCALAYVATAGWAAMVYAPSAAFFLAGVIMLVVGAPAAVLWFYFPYTHAVLEATPATLIKYEEGRCARKIGKAKTKAKLVAIFSKIVRTRYVADTFSEGPRIDQPLDDQMRSLSDLKVALVLAKVLRVFGRRKDGESQIDLLNAEIGMVGEYVGQLAEKQLTENEKRLVAKEAN